MRSVGNVYAVKGGRGVRIEVNCLFLQQVRSFICERKEE